jgi:hypothetical protein
MANESMNEHGSLYGHGVPITEVVQVLDGLNLRI